MESRSLSDYKLMESRTIIVPEEQTQQYTATLEMGKIGDGRVENTKEMVG